MSERTTLLIDPMQPVDAAWFSRLDAIKQDLGAEAYELLRPSKEATATAKEAFYASGKTENPDLRPVQIDPDTMHEQAGRFEQLKADVLSDDLLPENVRQLYRWRLNELIAGRRIVATAASGDTRRFQAYNRFVYGAPEPPVFAAVSDWFRSDAEAQLEHTAGLPASVHEAAEAVLAHVPAAGGGRDLLVPTPELFQAVRDQHYRTGGFYALVLAGVELPEKGPVTPDMGEPILTQVKSNLGADDYERVMTEAAAWSVSHHPKQLQGPGKYRMPLKRFVGLPIGHEWGSHVTEAINGSRSALRLLADGLDRYEAGNEGRAVMREQVPFASFDEFAKQLRWQDILRRHFAVSLAEGLSGDRTAFSEAYLVINAIDRLWERRKAPDKPEEADAKADTRTWNLLEQRIMKGTDGTGGAYLKDKVYLEGNVAAWGVAAHDPAMIDQGDRGKFDIANPRHVVPLRRLQIIEEAA